MRGTNIQIRDSIKNMVSVWFSLNVSTAFQSKACFTVSYVLILESNVSSLSVIYRPSIEF